MSNGHPFAPESVGRTTQIIAGALIMGVVVFGGFAFIAVQTGEGLPPQFPMISVLAAGFALMATLMRFVVPMIIVNSAKSQLLEADESERPNRLAALYQTKTIIGFALLEGAAFFNLLAYISEKQLWSYGVVAFLLGVMAISFPSQGQFENWAEEMKRDLN